MKRFLTLAALLLTIVLVPSCRRGNNYKVHFKVLRQNQSPAEGFRVDMSVKGKSTEVVTVKTDAMGMAEFTNLPTPDSKHPLQGVLHYYNGKEDDPREITYPFIESDAKRLKDTQYIPNKVTPEPA
jgi:hypothetical protein